MIKFDDSYSKQLIAEEKADQTQTLASLQEAVNEEKERQLKKAQKLEEDQKRAVEKLRKKETKVAKKVEVNKEQEEADRFMQQIYALRTEGDG